jgi:hypothetical protein
MPSAAPAMTAGRTMTKPHIQAIARLSSYRNISTNPEIFALADGLNRAAVSKTMNFI